MSNRAEIKIKPNKRLGKVWTEVVDLLAGPESVRLLMAR